MSEEIMKIKGHKCYFVLYNDKITIIPRGLEKIFPFMKEKTIKLKQIKSIYLKKPAIIIPGYIQFNFRGNEENKKGVIAAASDENCILISNKKEFQRIQEFKRNVYNQINNLKKENDNNDIVEKRQTEFTNVEQNFEESWYKKKPVIILLLVLLVFLPSYISNYNNQTDDINGKPEFQKEVVEKQEASTSETANIDKEKIVNYEIHSISEDNIGNAKRYSYKVIITENAT
ncbi:MAG: hypothetical protein ACOCV1_05195, partial [Bacillota bacterium]